jgi:hypothetical protein
MFKCATCQNSTGSLFNSTHRDGLQRPRTLGGVEHQSAELLELRLRVRRFVQARGSRRNIRRSGSDAFSIQAAIRCAGLFATVGFFFMKRA